MTLADRVAAVVAAVRVEHAPDPRVCVFEVVASLEHGVLTLRGRISEPAAAEALHRRFALLDGPLEVRDEVQRLPAEDAEAPFAIVRAPVAPMLAGPVVSEAAVSQAVLGQRLLVLREHGRWLHCRSSDGYLGWVHRGYVHRTDAIGVEEWEMGVGGVACYSLGALVRDGGGEVLARLPWGARVVLREDGTARLPDGGAGPVEGELVPLPDLPLRFPRAPDAMPETAAHWIGAPYLWGGITPAGVDCSGLAQAVYRAHGFQLPRDSDQQARTGEAVDPGRDFSRLLPGDLLFFAEEEGRVSHVALSTGGSRIIHSSLGNGGVRRNDLAGELPYERELRRLFVTARRLPSLAPPGSN
jgi:hypothetical protein